MESNANCAYALLSLLRVKEAAREEKVQLGCTREFALALIYRLGEKLYTM